MSTHIYTLFWTWTKIRAYQSVFFFLRSPLSMNSCLSLLGKEREVEFSFQSHCLCTGNISNHLHNAYFRIMLFLHMEKSKSGVHLFAFFLICQTSLYDKWAVVIQCYFPLFFISVQPSRTYNEVQMLVMDFFIMDIYLFSNIGVLIKRQIIRAIIISDSYPPPHPSAAQTDSKHRRVISPLLLTRSLWRATMLLASCEMSPWCIRCIYHSQSILI